MEWWSFSLGLRPAGGGEKVGPGESFIARSLPQEQTTGRTVPELSEELPLYVPARLVETPQPAAQAWVYGDVR